MENQNSGESLTDKVPTMYDNVLVNKLGEVFSKDHIKHSRSRGGAPYSCLVLGKALKSRKDKDGYLRFNTVHNTKHTTLLVHRVVAETFLGKRPDGMVIDHIDRNKTNNALANLRYVFPVENLRNSDVHKMTDEKKKEALKMRNAGANISKIARKLDVLYGSVKYYFKSLVDVPHFERNV